MSSRTSIPRTSEEYALRAKLITEGRANELPYVIVPDPEDAVLVYNSDDQTNQSATPATAPGCQP